MEAIVFGDIEDALRLYLGPLISASVSVGVPNPRPPSFVDVRRVGGPRKNLVTDSPTVTFECWAATGSDACDLANAVRAHIGALPGQVISGMTVHRVQEAAGPQSLPDPESDQPRYVFTASLDVRNP